MELRVSLEWLREYVHFDLDPHELAELLTMAGTAVDAVERLGAGLEGLLVGRVMEVRPHPDADRLSVCRVDLGGRQAEIVCGAPNVREGMLAPVAPPGVRLPDGSDIGEVVIRGVTSRGMLLSERELGLSDDAAGIMELEGAPEPGTPLKVALGEEDTVLVLEVTPNRPDCLCMLGVAREVAALTGGRLVRPSFELRECDPPTGEEVGVEIRDPDLCSRYAARLIEGLSIGASPWWMRRRLRAAGVRPISNVVDITNYVMLEAGQPLHAFDFELIAEGRIVVRRASAGESMVTLDGVERRLTPDDLLICDASGPVALAGVMGGENTEIGEGTTRVLLESAHFHPAGIMRTSRTQGLSSEASYRFERGVDPSGCVRAADRAAYLMQELAGGMVRRGAVDARAREIAPLRLDLRVGRAARLIGIDLHEEKARDILVSLELEVKGRREEKGEAVLDLEVPTFRPDLEREIDLVEEIARIYGYHRIPSTLPASSASVGMLSTQQRCRREAARAMAGLGLHEAVTVSFISERWLELLDPTRVLFPRRAVRLRNPLSEETAVLRPSLLPGLLEAARFNVNRRITDVHLFEMGRVFLPAAGEAQPREPLHLACLLTGDWMPKQWDGAAQAVDFFTAKGILERLASSLHVPGLELEREELPFLHPAQSCAVLVEGSRAGFLGLLHPRICDEVDLPRNTAVMELEFSRLEESRAEPHFREIPRFPTLQMDLAVVVDEEVEARDLETAIREAGGELLYEVRLFDLYRGEQLGEGKKSLAFNLVFCAMDRTLRDEEARSVLEDIVFALERGYGARLRA